ncbi:MAG: Smr/MutS family protein [Bacteroidales bacterium]|nr:Smr/MutS family protein [Bacteroidales bacterium]MCF8377420.1 Smr/MutS family protein [Bacteroidales bacterium]MCF8401632.1 Smr/MutS family protein [Bacteroidales bacterium]
MMIYPENFEEKVGFDHIRALLKKHCLCELGEDNVDAISFSADFERIDHQLRITEEFRELSGLQGGFPSQDYLNLMPELKRLRTEGTIIELKKLFDLQISLRTIQEIIHYLNKADEETYPLLSALTIELFDPSRILSRLGQILDEKGSIRDSASPALSEIRRKLISKRGQISGKIQKTLKVAKGSGWTDKDVEPTIRGGRLVIPLQSTHKRKIQGFIHDESASGQTVYIEPAEVFDTNNEIRDLENSERREIVKILTAFTQMIRPEIEELSQLYDFLGAIDFIRAKARLTGDIEGCRPELLSRQEIRWMNARHPLLFLSFRKQNKKVVPLNIDLDKGQRILLISGPNAGGKSVCLKTVGLLQYMLQCGLPVPMSPDSKAGIFEKLFIDIGDEQSLENDLSTYSSHLINMKNFLEKLNAHSLFLIDEFGAGTEPQLGGTVAESVLEKFNELKAFGVITTHYANLKVAADELPGVVNGAMLFDAKNLRPLYMLKTGKPGSSFAFEIAQHIGFPENILNIAKEKTGTTQIDFEKQLQKLETDKLAIDKKKTELQVADEFLAEMIGKYEKLNENLEHSRKEILKDAKEEAQKIISGSNKLIENTIREVREIQARKNKTKELRKKIEQHKEDIQKIPVKEKKNKPEKKPDTGPIQKGDHVKVKGHDKSGEVDEVRDGQAMVSFETFKLNISLDKLRKIDSPAGKTKQPTGKYGRILSDMQQKIENFKSVIDIRGKRVEEAITELGNYIDDAILLNIKEVQIIHGKGNGVLREVVRQYLSTVDEVKSYHDAHPDRGGHGTTLVNFKQ